jgi:DNA gyrase/topoisomerase IV subunit B
VKEGTPSIPGENIREGLTAVISVKVSNLAYDRIWV